jgi:hypothetical protein
MLQATQLSTLRKKMGGFQQSMNRGRMIAQTQTHVNLID